MNPWQREFEEQPELTVAEGIADRTDLKEELQHFVLRRPDFLIMEEVKTLRMALAIYGAALLTVSIASLGVLLYAVLE